MQIMICSQYATGRDLHTYVQWTFSLEFPKKKISVFDLGCVENEFLSRAVRWLTARQSKPAFYFSAERAIDGPPVIAQREKKIRFPHFQSQIRNFFFGNSRIKVHCTYVWRSRPVAYWEQIIICNCLLNCY